MDAWEDVRASESLQRGSSRPPGTPSEAEVLLQ